MYFKEQNQNALHSTLNHQPQGHASSNDKSRAIVNLHYINWCSAVLIFQSSIFNLLILLAGSWQIFLKGTLWHNSIHPFQNMNCTLLTFLSNLTIFPPSRMKTMVLQDRMDFLLLQDNFRWYFHPLYHFLWR